jgi:hypothetical protein
MIDKNVILKTVETDFIVTGVSGAKVAWKLENKFSDEYLLNEFAFITEDADCFDLIPVNKSKNVVLKAEHYGGSGVGENGGGVRVGNRFDYQLKGIGVNHLVGNNTDFDHSSGMYPLFEAITEAVNSCIYGEILPIGTIRTVALLSIGKSVAVNAKAYELAIGIREKSVRPAHFMKARHFKPMKKNIEKIILESKRINDANKQLRVSLKTNQGFISYLGSFLSNSAKQFAFSFVNRIAHGAVSPSNISIDGKWLDLTNTTFISCKDNYAASKNTVPFLNERQAIVEILESWKSSYELVNNIKFSTELLLNYYYEQVDAYSVFYVPLIFGIEPIEVKEPKLDIYKKELLNSYSDFIHSEEKIVVGFPFTDKHLKSPIFIYLCNIFRHASYGGGPGSANSLLELLTYTARMHFIDVEPYKVVCLIKSLRKVLFNELFYIGRIHSVTKAHLKNKENNVQSYIDSYRQVVSWLYHQGDQNEITIFCSNTLVIHYCPYKAIYCVNYIEIKYYYPNIESLKAYLFSLPDAAFSILSMDCKSRLICLLNTISMLDNNNA